jgi:hypothetical protein
MEPASGLIPGSGWRKQLSSYYPPAPGTGPDYGLYCTLPQGKNPRKILKTIFGMNSKCGGCSNVLLRVSDIQAHPTIIQLTTIQRYNYVISK